MITSTSNAKVKRLVNLKKKKKLRDEEGVFLVEGIRHVPGSAKRPSGGSLCIGRVLESGSVRL